MSHIVDLEVSLDNKEALEKALEELGYKVDDRKQIMRNNYSQSKEVDIQILKDGKKLPIGFEIKDDGNYHFVGDLYNTGIDKKTLKENVRMLHSKHKIIQAAKKQGYNCDSSKMIEKDGKEILELKLSTWDNSDGGVYATDFGSEF